MSVKNWNISNLEQQIEMGTKFVSEHVLLHSKVSSERFILGKYLRDCFRPSAYPFMIEDNIETIKSPDCILKLFGGFTIGLELTEAINQQYRNDEAAKIKVGRNQRCSYYTDPATMTVNVIRKSETESIGDKRILVGTEIRGQGWSGDSCEEHVADIIFDAIVRKSNKLSKWKENFDHCNLAIVPNPASGIFDRQPICHKVKDRLAKSSVQVYFSAIYLFDPSVDQKFDDYLSIDQGRVLVKKI